MFRTLLPLAALLVITPALAEDGATVLARVDAVADQGQDTTITMDVTVHDGRGGEASRVLRVWQKGSQKRLVKFLEPARLAGVGLLVPEVDSLYLYLPAYGRTRRVVGSGRGDAFMGTDFSMDDLARITFADEYTATLLSEDADHWQLRLDPIKPADHAHDHVLMWVRRGDDLFDRVDFVKGGEVTRRVQLDDVHADGSRPVAHRIVVEDLRSGRSTVAVVREIQFDTGLEDDLFTTRYLMRD